MNEKKYITVKGYNECSIFAGIKLLELDKECYEERYRFDFRDVLKTLLICRNSIFIAYFEDKIIGYLHFEAIKDKYIDKLRNGQYKGEEPPARFFTRPDKGKNLTGYVVSLVVHPEYRKSIAAMMLIKKGREEFKKLVAEGHLKNEFYASAVSTNGLRASRLQNCEEIHFEGKDSILIRVTDQ